MLLFKNKTKTANENKDYNTLRLYFKQFHEYVNYIDGFKHTTMSVSGSKEVSYSDKMISSGSFILYSNYKNKGNPQNTEKDIVLSFF